jgi:hypothetical protein
MKRLQCEFSVEIIPDDLDEDDNAEPVERDCPSPVTNAVETEKGIRYVCADHVKDVIQGLDSFCIRPLTAAEEKRAGTRTNTKKF